MQRLEEKQGRTDSPSGSSSGSDSRSSERSSEDESHGLSLRKKSSKTSPTKVSPEKRRKSSPSSSPRKKQPRITVSDFGLADFDSSSTASTSTESPSSSSVNTSATSTPVVTARRKLDLNSSQQDFEKHPLQRLGQSTHTVASLSEAHIAVRSTASSMDSLPGKKVDHPEIPEKPKVEIYKQLPESQKIKDNIYFINHAVKGELYTEVIPAFAITHDLATLELAREEIKAQVELVKQASDELKQKIESLGYLPIMFAPETTNLMSVQVHAVKCRALEIGTQQLSSTIKMTDNKFLLAPNWKTSKLPYIDDKNALQPKTKIYKYNLVIVLENGKEVAYLHPVNHYLVTHTKLVPHLKSKLPYENVFDISPSPYILFAGDFYFTIVPNTMDENGAVQIEILRIDTRAGGYHTIKYALALMENLPKGGEIKEPTNSYIYVEYNEGKGLRYTVRNPKGKTVTGQISEKDFDAIVGDEKSRIVADLENLPLNLTPFLKQILEKTSAVGHTYSFTEPAAEYASAKKALIAVGLPTENFKLDEQWDKDWINQYKQPSSSTSRTNTTTTAASTNATTTAISTPTTSSSNLAAESNAPAETKKEVQLIAAKTSHFSSSCTLFAAAVVVVGVTVAAVIDAYSKSTNSQ